MGNIESHTVAIVSSVAKKVGDVIIQNVQQQQQQQQQQPEQQQPEQQQPEQQQPEQHLSVGEKALIEEVTELEKKQSLTEADKERLLELQRRIERIKGLTEKEQLDQAEQEELHAWHNNTYDEWSNNRVVLELGAPPKPVAHVHFQEHIAVHAARAAPQMFARLRPLDEQESHIDPAVQEELGM